VVALSLVFIGVLMGFEDPPLNAVQMLWVNLIMDTMGALALGTEQPTDTLLERPPYRRNAFLLNAPMIRSILVQSAYQLVVLLVILTMGAEWFNVVKGNTCGQFDSSAYEGRTSFNWDLHGNWKSSGGEVGCSTFFQGTLSTGASAESAGYSQLDCSDDLTFTCYHHGYKDFDVNPKTHESFETICTTCKVHDYTHYTIIFNAFIFAQLFNEFNARSITNEWNVFTGLEKNPIFMVVIAVTIGLQIMLVEVGGEFVKTSPLNSTQWIATVLIGMVVIPLGILMRFIPATENPANYASPVVRN